MSCTYVNASLKFRYIPFIDSLECQQALEKLCLKLGVLVAKSMTEGPTTNITFLGIELDTVVMIVQLSTGRSCTAFRKRLANGQANVHVQRGMLSLIAQLQHACCVVKPGRSFLRRIITLSTVAKELHHRICLNRGFRLVLSWVLLYSGKFSRGPNFVVCQLTVKTAKIGPLKNFPL